MAQRTDFDIDGSFEQDQVTHVDGLSQAISETEQDQKQSEPAPFTSFPGDRSELVDDQAIAGMQTDSAPAESQSLSAVASEAEAAQDDASFRSSKRQKVAPDQHLQTQSGMDQPQMQDSDISKTVHAEGSSSTAASNSRKRKKTDSESTSNLRSKEVKKHYSRKKRLADSDKLVLCPQPWQQIVSILSTFLETGNFITIDGSSDPKNIEEAMHDFFRDDIPSHPIKSQCLTTTYNKIIDAKEALKNKEKDKDSEVKSKTRKKNTNSNTITNERRKLKKLFMEYLVTQLAEKSKSAADMPQSVKEQIKEMRGLIENAADVNRTAIMKKYKIQVSRPVLGRDLEKPLDLRKAKHNESMARTRARDNENLKSVIVISQLIDQQIKNASHSRDADRDSSSQRLPIHNAPVSGSTSIFDFAGIGDKLRELSGAFTAATGLQIGEDDQDPEENKSSTRVKNASHSRDSDGDSPMQRLPIPEAPVSRSKTTRDPFAEIDEKLRAMRGKFFEATGLQIGEDDQDPIETKIETKKAEEVKLGNTTRGIFQKLTAMPSSVSATMEVPRRAETVADVSPPPTSPSDSAAMDVEVPRRETVAHVSPGSASFTTAVTALPATLVKSAPEHPTIPAMPEHLKKTDLELRFFGMHNPADQILFFNRLTKEQQIQMVENAKQVNAFLQQQLNTFQRKR